MNQLSQQIEQKLLLPNNENLRASPSHQGGIGKNLVIYRYT